MPRTEQDSVGKGCVATLVPGDDVVPLTSCGGYVAMGQCAALIAGNETDAEALGEQPLGASDIEDRRSTQDDGDDVGITRQAPRLAGADRLAVVECGGGSEAIGEGL